MEKIKLFEDFIFETSSKKMNDVNNALEDVLKKYHTNSLDIEVMLFFILCANESYKNVKDVSDNYGNWRSSILKYQDFDFDFADGLEKFKELTKRNGNKMRGLSTRMEDFFEEDFNTLNAIEFIFDHYKKSKKKDSCTFHEFVMYFYKGEKLRQRTSSNSKESKDKIIANILKYGINVVKLRKDLDEYCEKNRHEGKLIINSTYSLIAGDTFDDDGGRHNEKNTSVMETSIWKDGQYKDSMIELSLFVDKDNYMIGIGYVGYRTVSPIILYKKDSEPIIFKEKQLEYLKNNLDNAEENFGKEKFQEYMENIFKIYADNGVVTNFDYGVLKEKIDKN